MSKGRALTVAVAATLAACARPGPAPRPHVASVALPERAASPYWLGPDDVREGRLVVELPAAPHGESWVVLVPALDVGAWRRGSRTPTPTALRARVEASLLDRPPTVGHALPPPAHLTPPAPSKKRPAEHALPPTRAFVAHSLDGAKTRSATGRLAFVGDDYAFYEDPTNGSNFTREEYAALDRTVEAAFVTVASVFGRPLDVDGNGHVVVFLSRTYADLEPGSFGSVRWSRTRSPDDLRCDDGEIVYAWSRDAYAGMRRDEHDEYAQMILHETLHLAHDAAATRAGAKPPRESIPKFFEEGDAESMRLITGLGLDAAWKQIDDALGSKIVEASPAEQPYALGGLFAWWLDARFGRGVHARLERAFAEPRADDFVVRATGVREPLALAMFWMSLHLDGTALAHATGLGLTTLLHHERAGHPSAHAMRPGDALSTSASYTGHVALRIAHATPVRVVLEAEDDGAYVVVAQP